MEVKSVLIESASNIWAKISHFCLNCDSELPHDLVYEADSLNVYIQCSFCNFKNKVKKLAEVRQCK